MVKRGKLEIIRDILLIIRENRNSIRITVLIRKSNLSTSRFKIYFSEILEKRFAREIVNSSGEKHITLTEKGFKFLERYNSIIDFISEFEL